ncbi:MAG: gliding motility lipoprotein GldB [Flavobacterium sp.]
MRNVFLFAFVLLALVSCKEEKDKVEEKVAAVKVGKIEIERFDKEFYESSANDISAVKQKYPFFFPVGNPDAIWTDKIKDPLLQELHGEVEKAFPNTKSLEEDFYSLFQHIKYYYPDFRTPKVITLISEMDYESKVIYADTLLLVSLDLYLGKDHKFYEFPAYQKQNFEPRQIMPDAAQAFAETKIPPIRDRDMLAQMIYFGKQLYMKDLLIPEYTDAEKMGYTQEQQLWAEANEEEIWRYFIENKVLYDTDPKLPGRFINPAPFSKFYLEIDNESPGRVGQWIGWQIVRAYAKNHKDVPLQQLLMTDAKTIFENSKYKPKKTNG